jgi:Secretion system C-terminal sorting domain/Cellulase (glycosyl hydrolase family 5)
MKNNNNNIKNIFMIPNFYQTIKTSTMKNLSGIIILTLVCFGNLSMNSLYGSNDLTLIGNIDNDANDEIVFFNRSTVGSTIRAIDLVTGTNDAWINYNPVFSDFFDESDKAFLGDVNQDNLDDLILVNQSSYTGIAILVINLSDGGIIQQINHGGIDTWLDDNDKVFIGDVDGNNSEDLILLNMSGNLGFLKIIDLSSGQTITTIDYSDVYPSMNGWLDEGDKIFLGKVDSDSFLDMVFVNTAYNSGAIRVLEIMNSTTIKWIDHGTFGGLMDEPDRMLFGDVNNDNMDDLVFLNTNYSGISIKSFDIMNNAFINTLFHGKYNGWMDACDRIFLADVDGNSEKDILFVNTTYNSGAIYAVDLSSEGELSWINHGLFEGWMDIDDKMVTSHSNNSNILAENLLLINTSGNYGAIRVVDVVAQSDILSLTYNEVYPTLNGWLDGRDNNSNLCIDGSNPGSWTNPFVSIDDKSGLFYSYGAPFYPKVLNYGLEINSFDGVDLWLNPSRSYYLDKPIGVPQNPTDGQIAINEDLDKIVHMGFNTIRACILGLPEADLSVTDNNLYFWYKEPDSGNAMRVVLGSNYEPLLNLIDNLVKSAKSHGLKIILLTGGRYCDGPIESEKYNLYLSSLGEYLKDKSTIIAFDLVNEPSRDSANKYKYDKCTNAKTVHTWREALRQTTPFHLVTIGLFNHKDVLWNWDHKLMDVDFISIHEYPGGILSLSDQTQAVSRDLFWIDNNIDKPWIIGETMYEAYDGDYPYCRDASSGTELDQMKYVHSTISLTRNCGGIGYSWWEYQDREEGGYAGILTSCERIKPSASEFIIDGFDIPCGECSYPGDEIYFNFNSSGVRIIKGQVVISDSTQLGIPDAVVRLTNNDGIDNYLHYTFTNSEGYFLVYYTRDDSSLECMISAPGMEVVKMYLTPPVVEEIRVIELMQLDCSLKDRNNKLELLNESGTTILDVEGHLSLFPNPCQDFIFVENTRTVILKVEIFDLKGKLLIQQSGNKHKYLIDMVNFAPGLYIVKTQGLNGSTFSKIVVF